MAPLYTNANSETRLAMQLTRRDTDMGKLAVATLTVVAVDARRTSNNMQPSGKKATSAHGAPCPLTLCQTGSLADSVRRSSLVLPLFWYLRKIWGAEARSLMTDFVLFKSVVVLRGIA
eukprot:1501896-Amphidinium_carterae.1